MKRKVLIPAAVAMAAAMVASVPVATAAPYVTDADFYVVNATNYEIMLVSYTTGNPYPEYVRPEPTGPKDQWFSRVPPGGKFIIGLRWENKTQTQKINFDTFDSKGNRIPAGQVILKLEGTSAYGHDYGEYAGCWGGPGRTCLPLAGPNALPPTNTVTFSG